MIWVFISFIGILFSLSIIKNAASEGFLFLGWICLAFNIATLIMNVALL